MSRSGEMKEKYDKIRELQEQRDRREREAQSQADELDAILQASREAHGETPLVSSSRLSGPGFGTPGRRSAAPPSSPEDAYSANFAKSYLASPEAFSRNRGVPTAIPDGSVAGMQQRTASSTAAVVGAAGPRQREPDSDPLGVSRDGETRIMARPPARAPTTDAPESTVTKPAKAFAASKSEVTQVVRRRAAHHGNKPRREPPPVPPQNLASPAIADGPAIIIPTPARDVAMQSEDTPIVNEPRRVVFVRPAATPATSRMVTNRPENYGTLPFEGSPNHRTHDTSPFGPDTRRVVLGSGDNSGVTTPDDTSPGQRERTTPGDTPPFGSPSPDRDTSPGMGDTPAPFEATSPGTIERTSPGAIETEHEPIESTSPGVAASADIEIEIDEALVEATPAPVLAPMYEDTDGDARYKRVKEIDALIARFAADVEVKVGQGRDNTFLRKRSDIVPDDDEFPDERTQPRHRNIEVRRENTEIIPRRLPPRKRK